MKRLIVKGITVVLLVAALALLSAISAFADTNPNVTGQPSQTCLSSTAPNEPGMAASSPGSPFNEVSGIAGPLYAGNGATTNTPASGNAVSQYDVACFQVSQPPQP